MFQVNVFIKIYHTTSTTEIIAKNDFCQSLYFAVGDVLCIKLRFSSLFVLRSPFAATTIRSATRTPLTHGGEATARGDCVFRSKMPAVSWQGGHRSGIIIATHIHRIEKFQPCGCITLHTTDGEGVSYTPNLSNF